MKFKPLLSSVLVLAAIGCHKSTSGPVAQREPSPAGSFAPPPTVSETTYRGPVTEERIEQAKELIIAKGKDGRLDIIEAVKAVEPVVGAPGVRMTETARWAVVTGDKCLELQINKVGEVAEASVRTVTKDVKPVFEDCASTAKLTAQ